MGFTPDSISLDFPQTGEGVSVNVLPFVYKSIQLVGVGDAVIQLMGSNDNKSFNQVGVDITADGIYDVNPIVMFLGISIDSGSAAEHRSAVLAGLRGTQ